MVNWHPLKPFGTLRKVQVCILYIYMYIPGTRMTSIFEGQPPQNKAFSNQSKGHLSSRYIYHAPPPSLPFLDVLMFFHGKQPGFLGGQTLYFWWFWGLMVLVFIQNLKYDRIWQAIRFWIDHIRKECECLLGFSRWFSLSLGEKLWFYPSEV